MVKKDSELTQINHMAPDLVRRTQSGDDEAFGILYQGLSPQIYRYVLSHVNGRREVAEDLTADVFLKAYEKIGTYVDKGLPFTAWLYRVARNHIVDHHRGAHQRADATSLDSVPEIADRRATVGTQFERLIGIRDELATALDELYPDQQTAVSLRFLAGLSTAETAEAMGKTEDSVKKLQARGMASLRESITRGGTQDPRRRQHVWTYNPDLDQGVGQNGVDEVMDSVDEIAEERDTLKKIAEERETK